MGRSRNPECQLLFSGRCPSDVGLSEHGVRDINFVLSFNLPSLIFILSRVEKVGTSTCMICAFFLIDYLPCSSAHGLFVFF